MNFTKASILALSVAIFTTGCSSKEETIKNNMDSKQIVSNSADLDK